MKIISLFNNKGGVGKSTLGFHLGCALGELGKKTLLVDLDPQCNMTISGMFEEDLHDIWEKEDFYIADYEKSVKQLGLSITNSPRSIHFLLKPADVEHAKRHKGQPIIRQMALFFLHKPDSYANMKNDQRRNHLSLVVCSISNLLNK